MNQHTTEPWIAHGLAIRTPGIEDGTHEWLMQAACAEPSVKDYGNIKRASDCVNACKGMDNPKADIEALRTALQDLLSCVATANHILCEPAWDCAICAARGALNLPEKTT